MNSPTYPATVSNNGCLNGTSSPYAFSTYSSLRASMTKYRQADDIASSNDCCHPPTVIERHNAVISKNTVGIFVPLMVRARLQTFVAQSPLRVLSIGILTLLGRQDVSHSVYTLTLQSPLHMLFAPVLLWVKFEIVLVIVVAVPGGSLLLHDTDARSLTCFYSTNLLIITNCVEFNMQFIIKF